jgi:hypothetical protein
LLGINGSVGTGIVCVVSIYINPPRITLTKLLYEDTSNVKPSIIYYSKEINNILIEGGYFVEIYPETDNHTVNVSHISPHIGIVPLLISSKLKGICSMFLNSGLSRSSTSFTQSRIPINKVSSLCTITPLSKGRCGSTGTG